MKPLHLFLKIVLINSLFCQSLLPKFSMESIKSYFFGKPYEEVIQKEFAAHDKSIIDIHNKKGNITINEWNQQIVQLKAIKSTHEQDDLGKITIQTTNKNNKLCFKTVIEHKEGDKKTDGTIDYQLLVPQGAKIKAATEHGNIVVDTLTAPLKTKTKNGNIIISNTKDIVYAETNCGNISIHNVVGTTWATTEYGNISVDKTPKKLIARTKNGNICTSCETTELATMNLETEHGNIMLALPKESNATIEAATKKGKLTCDHFITLAPQTVQLNKKTWNKMKKEISGSIGAGTAQINLKAVSGNIKITETT